MGQKYQKGRKSMKKFGEFICKHKIAILIIAVLLCIPSIYGMMATRVNYDILSYLESRLNIKINYMTVSRYDMLTVGTLTKFFKESGREYFEKV